MSKRWKHEWKQHCEQRVRWQSSEPAGAIARQVDVTEEREQRCSSVLEEGAKNLHLSLQDRPSCCDAGNWRDASASLGAWLGSVGMPHCDRLHRADRTHRSTDTNTETANSRGRPLPRRCLGCFSAGVGRLLPRAIAWTYNHGNDTMDRSMWTLFAQMMKGLISMRGGSF